MRNPRHSQGMILIVVLAALALVAVLGITFVNVASIERTLGSNYVIGIRARIVAESGTELAAGRLLALCGRVPREADLEALRYEAGAAPGIENAAKVSFPCLKSPAISGIVGGSFTNDGDYFRLRVTAAEGRINVNDGNRKWNIDTDTAPDGDPVADAADLAAAKGRLTMLVAELIEILFPEKDDGFGELVADALFTARAAIAGERFGSIRDVEAAISPSILTPEEFARFTDFITLHSWRDPHTLRPAYQCRVSTPNDTAIPLEWQRDMYLGMDFQTREFALEPRSPVNVNVAPIEILTALLRPLQGWYLRDGPGACRSIESGESSSSPWLWAYDGNQQYGPSAAQYYWRDSIEPMMVYKSTATPFRAADLSGRDNANSRLGQPFLTPDLASLLGGAFPAKFADALHARIHGGGGAAADPIETWQEFEYVVETILADLFPETSAALDVFWQDWTPQPLAYDMPSRWGYHWTWVQGEQQFPLAIDTAYWRAECRGILRDLLLAAFNPNSQLQDGNPDRTLARAIDKAHLTRYTTELSLQLTGVFHIDSLGVIEDATGKTAAKVEVRSVVELCRPYRVTTQAQFMQGMASPADMAEAAPGARAAWDCRVTSYPEPWLKNSATGKADPAYFAGAVYDGYLMPSAWAPAPDAADLGFHASFEGALQPDIAADPALFTWDGGGLWASVMNDSSCPLQYGDIDGNMPRLMRLRNQPTTNRLMAADDGDAATAPEPGVLLPDGAYSDAGRGLAWKGVNFGGDSGKRCAVEFWVKPNFNPAHTTRIRSLFDFTRNRFMSAKSLKDQVFGLWFQPHYGFQQDERLDGDYGYPASRRHRALSTCSMQFSITNVIGTGRATHIVTPTAVHRYPNQDEARRGSHNSQYFESHQWSHVALAWNLNLNVSQPGCSSNPAARLLLLNGRNPVLEGPFQARDKLSDYDIDEDFYLYLHKEDYWAGPNWAKFGGLASGSSFNDTGDCTFDEIHGYRSENLPAPAVERYFKQGRFYCPPDKDSPAVYTSAPFALAVALGLSNRRASLLTVAWTAVWPRYSERRNFAGGGVGAVEIPELLPVDVNPGAAETPDPLQAIRGWDAPRDPVSIDIGMAAADGATEWMADLDGDGGGEREAMAAYAGGTTLRWQKNGQPMAVTSNAGIRLRVAFNQEPGAVAMEAPVLDDVTVFVHIGVVMLWQEARE